MCETMICYLCDVSEFMIHNYINKYNENYICYNCEKIVPMNFIENKDKCCKCDKVKNLIKLPKCEHNICLDCCKEIYFGITKNERPTHWNEVKLYLPDWPYESNELEEDDIEILKYEEYLDFEMDNFNYETNTYDELLEIRDNLISKRPEWMNTSEFIKYENHTFTFYSENVRINNEWNNFMESKVVGDKCCPVCKIK